MTHCSTKVEHRPFAFTIPSPPVKHCSTAGYRHTSTLSCATLPLEVDISPGGHRPREIDAVVLSLFSSHSPFPKFIQSPHTHSFKIDKLRSA